MFNHHLCFISLDEFYVSVAYVDFALGTESEISFSVAGSSKIRRGRESMSINSASAKLLPNPKPVRIAAINGKPRVQRYLSRECKLWFDFILAC